jgi:hypothetical protein
MDDHVDVDNHVVAETCIHRKLTNSMDDLSEMSPSDDDDDSYTTYNDEDFANDDECDDDDNTVDEVFKRVDIEWITTAITRILSDDDDDDHDNSNHDNDDDTDDEKTATSKQGISLEWSRLGLLSEAISQFIEEEEECIDDVVLCVESENVILNGLPLLADASSSSEASTSR